MPPVVSHSNSISSFWIEFAEFLRLDYSNSRRFDRTAADVPAEIIFAVFILVLLFEIGRILISRFRTPSSAGAKVSGRTCEPVVCCHRCRRVFDCDEPSAAKAKAAGEHKGLT